jgi:hypothetical protein
MGLVTFETAVLGFLSEHLGDGKWSVAYGSSCLDGIKFVHDLFGV